MSASDTFTKFTPYPENPNEEYMSENQRSHFFQILTHWKDELMAEVDRTVENMRTESSTNPSDMSDRATLEEVFNLELRTRDRERRLIFKIKESLEKIKKNDYGYCDSCGCEIGIRRLEARPTASMCIDCKTFAEIKERQTNL
jgi:DnaK suppressor protein